MMNYKNQKKAIIEYLTNKGVNNNNIYIPKEQYKSVKGVTDKQFINIVKELSETGYIAVTFINNNTPWESACIIKCNPPLL